MDPIYRRYKNSMEHHVVFVSNILESSMLKSNRTGHISLVVCSVMSFYSLRPPILRGM